MARLPRLVVPGLPHYLVQRGNNGQALVIDDDDRRRYLAMLHDAAHACQVLVHAYALLDNQLHLLLLPGNHSALGTMVQAVGRRYAGAFNRRHARSGTLWEGRYRAGAIEPGFLVLQCMQLIDLLAVRAALAPSPQASPWSSAPHHLGLRRDPLVSDPPEYWQLGNTPFEREAAYAALLARGPDEGTVGELQHAALNGWALGSPRFLEGLAQRSGRPPRPRPRGRPARGVPPG